MQCVGSGGRIPAEVRIVGENTWSWNCRWFWAGCWVLGTPLRDQQVLLTTELTLSLICFYLLEEIASYWHHIFTKCSRKQIRKSLDLLFLFQKVIPRFDLLFIVFSLGAGCDVLVPQQNKGRDSFQKLVLFVHHMGQWCNLDYQIWQQAFISGPCCNTFWQ